MIYYGEFFLFINYWSSFFFILHHYDVLHFIKQYIFNILKLRYNVSLIIVDVVVFKISFIVVNLIFICYIRLCYYPLSKGFYI